MVMRRKISVDGRINIGDDARGDMLTGKVTVSGTLQGILISPYQFGDENRPDCKVTVWDAGQRIVLPIQLRQKANMVPGDMVDLLFPDDDGSVLLIPARDTCTLCGKASINMIRLPNGRQVCEKCRKRLCSGKS